MEDAKLFFERAIQQAFGSQPDLERLELESLMRLYGISEEHVVSFQDCLYSLRRFLPLKATALPQDPGILALAVPSVPSGIRYSDGTHVPYPVSCAQADNLRSAAEAVLRGANPPRYVSYAIVSSVKLRHIFVSSLSNELKFESERPVIAFDSGYHPEFDHLAT
ncbi:MAG: hypothetical protein JWN74_261 [Acidobacteriaceae bacterium]|nr:hypothetical protein [Acidobacteriaceae bacterium]